MKVKMKLAEKAKCPVKKTSGASGYDIFTNESATLNIGETKVIKTGLSIQLPKNYEAQIRPRSGLSSKGILVHFGTIDADYTGEIGIIISNFSNEILEVEKHSRMAQMVISMMFFTYFVDEPFEITERGENGFNSTGVK